MRASRLFAQGFSSLTTSLSLTTWPDTRPDRLRRRPRLSDIRATRRNSVPALMDRTSKEEINLMRAQATNAQTPRHSLSLQWSAAAFHNGCLVGGVL
ncbi:hypothetical protein FB45DRAFT_1036256 [Roridomyces roridus]|uniref:Uncharacterized protein n=1 Tax=Roridomyces roridus TaxID=1738132 RepID=A0AAD7B9T2_9AGAR|nr:hypothetical protein FB45DRAFT_1036256 [Roridomyces roridus]